MYHPHTHTYTHTLPHAHTHTHTYHMYTHTYILPHVHKTALKQVFERDNTGHFLKLELFPMYPAWVFGICYQ